MMTHYKFWMVFAEGGQAPNKQHFVEAEAIPKGGIPWNKGRPWSEAERKKISEGKRHAV